MQFSSDWLIDLAVKHPTFLQSMLLILLGRILRPLAVAKALFQWAHAFVDSFYEFKANCAQSKERYALRKGQPWP